MANLIDAELWDDPQTANYLHITERTLRLWRRSRGLPHFKITAKIIRYRKCDVDGWLSRKRKAVTA